MIALYLTLIDEEEQQNKFELLYFKYRNLMYYIAEGVLNNPNDSEDAVQEALIRVAKNMDKIGDIDSSATKNFLGIITKREAMKLYDKNIKVKSGGKYRALVKVIYYDKKKKEIGRYRKKSKTIILHNQ